MTDLCDELQEAVKTKSHAKDVLGPPGLRLPSSRGWAQCPPRRSLGPACPRLPHAWGPRPRIHLRRSIVAPAFSSHGLCQAEQPREQSEREVWASPELQKLLQGALGLREGRARPVAWELPEREKEPEAALHYKINIQWYGGTHK